MSQSGRHLPPPLPSMPQVIKPSFFAASNARIMFGLLPLVVKPTKTSPGLPIASICREKIEEIPPAPGPETVVRWRAHLFEERRRQREQGEESQRNLQQTMRGIGNAIGALAADGGEAAGMSVDQ